MDTEKVIEATNLIPNKYFLEEAKKEEAFESNGVKYYQFTDGGVPIYQQRLNALHDLLRKKEDLGITGAVLEQHIALGLKNCNNKEMNDARFRAEMSQMLEMLDWRRKQDANLDLIYDLATVWYFDESEDPAIWSESYSKKKKARWLEDRELYDFFLRTPLTQYIDLSMLLVDGTKAYLKKMYETMVVQQQILLSKLSEDEMRSGLGQSMLLLEESYRAMINLIDLEQPSISK